MATILFRPELQNPVRDAGVAFTYTGKNGVSMEVLNLVPGVNRKVNDEAWETLNTDNSEVAALIKIGAIEVLSSEREKELRAEAARLAGADDLSDVLGLAIPKAVTLIDSTSDVAFLKRWAEAEGRTTVINKINGRIARVQLGNA